MASEDIEIDDLRFNEWEHRLGISEAVLGTVVVIALLVLIFTGIFP